MKSKTPSFLAILATFAFSLPISCSSSDPGSKTPAEESTAQKPAPESAAPVQMVFEGPGETLPRTVGKWSIASPPRYFGPDNLYDLINGGAEIYVEFGLVKMVTAEYKNEERPDLSVTAEVYDMGSLLGAFGRTARFLAERVDPSGAGEGLPDDMAPAGIMGEGDLVIWKDRYLVHLTLMDERADATRESIAAAGKEALPSVAKAILAKVDGPGVLPEIFAKFPAEHRLGRSEACTPSDLTGVKGLAAGYSVRYVDGDKTWTAFATEELDDKARDAAWEAVKGAEAQGRRVTMKAAGKRLVGLVHESGEIDEKDFESLSEGLLAAFE